MTKRRREREIYILSEFKSHLKQAQVSNGILGKNMSSQ